MKYFLRFWLPLILVIGVSYQWVDRPLCEWVYNRGLREHFSPVATLVEWPPLVTGAAPLLLIAASFLPAGRPRHLLMLTGFSVLVAYVLKNDLKWVFSRYWPMTFVQNPSWIHDHAYGFQWFQGGVFRGNDQTGSFPSGHSAVAFAALLPLGLVYRRLMAFVLVLAPLEALSMVAFDYHFLSDVLAGSLTGIFCVLLVEKLLGIPDRTNPLPGSEGHSPAS